MAKIIRIGRLPGNDVVFDNSTVSKEHAELSIAGNGGSAILRDLNSKNGTFVDNKRITQPTEVNHNSKLRFGTEETTLSFILNRTIVVDRFPSDPNVRTIGRGADCQIRLNYDDVSTHHAVLSRRSDGSVYIEDTRSTNGTFVNGERIISRNLQKGDSVTITRNHALDWEGVFPPSGEVVTPLPSPKPKAFVIAAIALLVLCVGGVVAYLVGNQRWDEGRIYSEYNTAVCWTCVQYGYRITLDGKDCTSDFCEIFEIPQAELVHIGKNGLQPGATLIEGTSFFISQDGKLATNLHVVKPWLFSDDIEKLQSACNQLLAMLATVNPTLNRSQLKIEGVTEAMFIIPNGLPLSGENAVSCSVLNSYDDINKDVAILQTETRALPQRVKNIVDITNADLAEEAITEGKQVFTVGFPFGLSLAMSSNQELKNQVQGGTITQNRGLYEFGHNAATAGGASGSPIINDKGRLVGILNAGVQGTQGFNTGIKAKYIVDLMK